MADGRVLTLALADELAYTATLPCARDGGKSPIKLTADQANALAALVRDYVRRNTPT
jgi:hypothetical protein